MRVWDQATREEAGDVEGRIISICGSLGGNTSTYGRERGRALRAFVSEIHDLPHVSAVANICPNFSILKGFALDLTTHHHDGRHWDFDEEERRERARAKVKAERPRLLIGSPMCAASSACQHTITT